MCAIIGFDSPTLTEQEIRPYFDRTISRGPDMSRMEKAGRGMLGFHRLAIMGLHEEGMQPFHLGGDMAVCNGELYGFRPLKKELEAKGYTFASESDCELILPLYREYGVEMFAKLDAEFAMIIYDAKADRLVAARDPIGIRPLFYGYLADGGILFASEAKNLVGLCERIMPFPPGHYYADGKFVRYADLTTVTEYSKDDLDTVCKKIREKLIAGVEKRLDADAPLGFLLSGGLDSSLVCAISAKLLGKRIRTFASRGREKRSCPTPAAVSSVRGPSTCIWPPCVSWARRSPSATASCAARRNAFAARTSPSPFRASARRRTPFSPPAARRAQASSTTRPASRRSSIFRRCCGAWARG